MYTPKQTHITGNKSCAKVSTNSVKPFTKI